MSSTSEGLQRPAPLSVTPRRTPVVIRYSPKVRRRVIKPDYHEPQPVGKPTPFNKAFIGPAQSTPSCSKDSYTTMPGLGYAVGSTSKAKTANYKVNAIKHYAANSSPTPIKTYSVQKKAQTDRVLRNRTFPTANRHKPVKYKDSTERNTMFEGFGDGRSLRPMPKVHKDNENFGRELYTDTANLKAERYKDSINNCTLIDLLRPRQQPESDDGKLYRQSDAVKRPFNVEPQRLIKHRPAILANDSAKMVQRSIERARVKNYLGVSRLDDRSDGTRTDARAVLPSTEVSY